METVDFEKAYMDSIQKEDRLAKLEKYYGEKQNITKEDIGVLLQIAICDEQLAEFNYMCSYNLSKTEGKSDVDPEFDQHESEEREHKHQLINRLREMGIAVPVIEFGDFTTLNSSGKNWKQEHSTNSLEILKNRYEEELSAIHFYSIVLKAIHTMKKQSGEFDSTTEMIIKKIKADEEAHAKDLYDLMVEYGVER